MNQTDNRTLIEQTHNGNTAAFDILVQRYWQDAYRTARRYLDTGAEDVIQDAFTQAYLQLPTLKDPDRFPHWLHTIVRNACISQLRRRPVHLSYEEIAESLEIPLGTVKARIHRAREMLKTSLKGKDFF